MTVKDLKDFLKNIDDDLPLYNMGHSAEVPVESLDEVLDVGLPWKPYTGELLPKRLTFFYD